MAGLGAIMIWSYAAQGTIRLRWLWLVAPHNLTRAEELRLRLSRDAESTRRACEAAAKSDDQERLERLVQMAQGFEQEIAHVDEIIRQLRRGS
jgi:hypothetical protein